MAADPDPSRVRALAERLVGIPTAGPDPSGARACADAIRDALPPGAESGEWPTGADGPIVWARLGRGKPTLLLLAHYDTVGISEYAALRAPAGEAIARKPAELIERLLASDPDRLPPAVAADLDEERGTPGTWMFGRGALDMKGGIAAGVAAFGAMANPADPPGGSVMFVACPDEEGRSAGMLVAVERLAEIARRARLELRGAFNLDYAEAPVAYEGLAGKLLVGLWILGAPTHVGNPFGGVDAAQLAAVIVTRVTTGTGLLERGPGGTGPPPVALRMRDLKRGYDVQTALEAEVELNLLTYGRPLARTIEILRGEVAAAMSERSRAMESLREWSGRPRGARTAGAETTVITYPELVARAGDSPAATAEALRARAGGGSGTPGGSGHADAPNAGDFRATTRERIRSLANRAGLSGPLVVISLLPPYYPHAAPRAGGLAERLRPLLARERVEMKAFYPFISDAAYLAWRADEPGEIGALMPSLGRQYGLPVEAARVLDLEVLTIGPWGRDAHGLYERVHAPHAFGILPGRIAAAAREALRD